MTLDETIAGAVVQAVLKEIRPMLERSENRVLCEATVLEMLISDVAAYACGWAGSLSAVWYEVLLFRERSGSVFEAQWTRGVEGRWCR